MDCPSTDVAVGRLKKHSRALAKCEVIDAGGVVTPVAIPKKHQKWASLARTFDELGWKQIKALDKDGALLELLELATMDSDDEIVDELPDDLDSTLKFAERMVQLSTNAQKAALAPYMQYQKISMEGMANMVKVLTERLVQLERMFGKTLKLAHDTALSGDEDGGSDSAIMGMLGQVMFMQAKAKAAAAAEAAGAGAQTASPKNGTPE